MSDREDGRPTGRAEGRAAPRKAGKPEGRKDGRATGDTVRVSADLPRALYTRLVSVAADQRSERGEFVVKLIDQGLARYGLDATLRAAMGEDAAAA